MAKKEKKEKKSKKSGKEEKLSRREQKKLEKAARDSWIYYSDSSVTLIVSVLVIFCVLDIVLAWYAIAYTKRIERENVTKMEAASKPVERSSRGEVWYLLKDGSIVYENPSAEPAVPGWTEGEPAESENTEAPAEGEGESAEAPQP